MATKADSSTCSQHTMPLTQPASTPAAAPQALLTTLVDLFEAQDYPATHALAKRVALEYPSEALAWRVLGYVLQAQENYADSIAPLKQALAIAADDPVAQHNLGMALVALNQADQALPYLQEAVRLNPGYGKALVNLAMVQQFMGDVDAAQTSCEAALRVDEQDASAYVQLGKVFEEKGQLSQAQACYYRADMAHEPRREVAHSNVLYLLNHDVLVEPQHLFEEHLTFGQRFEAPLLTQQHPHTNSKDPGRVLHIGFVSGDLNHHALANFLEPLFEQLSKKSSMRLHAFYTKSQDDEYTQRMRQQFHSWHSVVDLDDAQLAELVRAEKIDILIDLAGHTAKNRLLAFARKPAPIQASWLGYLGTTGLRAMDYYICDAHWIPPGELDWQFVEKMAYLPSVVTFKPHALSPPVSSLPALTHGAITFGSFNRVNKINASVIALWSMLLRSIPSASLFLCAIENEAEDKLIKDFEVVGISGERLAFCPRVATADYLALHHQVDICLDTFPHAGGATTANAAWMGVPTLGLAGQTPPSRFSAALMHQLGLDDFVAGSIEEFVHIGRYWSQNLAALAQLRASMRQRFAASMLGQSEVFASSFDAMLRTMWQRWCEADAVETININSNYFFPANPNGRVETILSALPHVVVISASKLSESTFWAQSALGQSIKRLVQQGENISVDIAFENARGLPEIFNAAIERAHDEDILVFIHDDVWIDEYHFSQAVTAGLEQFDVIGVAGNKRRLPNQPAWCFVDQKLTWDEKCNLSGQVSHGENKFGKVSEFGAIPAACELLDGVFIAVHRNKLITHKVKFDPLFDFHFYDMDFSRTARESGLNLGTWLIQLTHQSGGAFGTPHWQRNFVSYQQKFNEKLQPMKQTPPHDNYNPDLLKIIPKNLKRIVEVGCSSGALARAYLSSNPDCEYIGIEIDADYASVASNFCSKVIIKNIESMDDEDFLSLCTADAWIFGDALEHLYDPWTVLQKIKKYSPPGTLILSCIPNAQHWSLIANLALGTFRYQDSGLLDRTHIRWFTRLTMIELFESTGFTITEGFPRIFNEPGSELILPHIGSLVKALGGDANEAMQNVMPLQYIIKASAR